GPQGVGGGRGWGSVAGGRGVEDGMRCRINEGEAGGAGGGGPHEVGMDRKWESPREADASNMACHAGSMRARQREQRARGPTKWGSTANGSRHGRPPRRTCQAMQQQ